MYAVKIGVNQNPSIQNQDRCQSKSIKTESRKVSIKIIHGEIEWDSHLHTSFGCVRVKLRTNRDLGKIEKSKTGI